MSDYVWFVEPLNADTNSIIGKEINAREISEEKFLENVFCGDHQRRSLWQCSNQLLAMLQKSKKSLGLQFRIFNKRGNGQIRECKFFYRKKRRKFRTTQLKTAS